jgi:hypothetical protein
MSATQKFNIVKIILNKSIFDDNVITIILQCYWNILDYKRKILLNWIDIKQLYWTALSTNPSAIDLLKENQHKINWGYLSTNPNAIDLLKENQDKINWDLLHSNPNAIEILKYNEDKIDWRILSSNINAIHLIKKRITYEYNLTFEEYIKLKNKVNWSAICRYPYINIIHILKKRIKYEKNLSKNNYNKLEYNEIINWRNISANPNAIELLKENQDKIHWDILSSNPNAIEILKNNQRYINWLRLSKNPNAIELLKNNKDKIYWGELSENPNAIDMIKHKIQCEKTKTSYFNDYNFNYYINWSKLSSNPNAIQILKDNKNKIDWNNICIMSKSNDSIILLKEKTKYELQNNFIEINWYFLSNNPFIFENEPMPII